MAIQDVDVNEIYTENAPLYPLKLGSCKWGGGQLLVSPIAAGR